MIDRPKNEYILLASDGIWECAIQLIYQQKILENNQLGKLFNQLIAKSMNQEYGQDKMSAILMQF